MEKLVLIFVIVSCSTLVHARATGSTPASTGFPLAVRQCFNSGFHNYPPSCPRPTDFSSYTRCCEDNFGRPSCCPGRSTYMCTNLNPVIPVGYYCPQPSDASYKTECCGTKNINGNYCCGSEVDISIQGWVVGVIIVAVVIFIIFLALIVCCCCGTALGCARIVDCLCRRGTYNSM